MVSIPPISTILILLVFVKLTVFQLTLCQIEEWQTIVLAESTASTTILQQTVEITSSNEDVDALLNVTIPFQNDACTNPVVEIYREGIDYDDDDEYLEFFYGAYNNDSLIFRCGETDDDSEFCGAFNLCGEFTVPPGDYTMLEFFIFKTAEVQHFCGDGSDEPGPLRSVRVRFQVSCQVDVECGDDDPSEEDEDEPEESGSGSSSEDGARTMQKVEHSEDMQVSPIYSRDIESNKGEVDNIAVRIDCDSYFNILLMIVLCICVCWVAQCAFFCRYK